MLSDQGLRKTTTSLTLLKFCMVKGCSLALEILERVHVKKMDEIKSSPSLFRHVAGYVRFIWPALRVHCEDLIINLCPVTIFRKFNHILISQCTWKYAVVKRLKLKMKVEKRHIFTGSNFTQAPSCEPQVTYAVKWNWHKSPSGNMIEFFI